VAIKSVTNSNDLMIITKNGIAIRMNVADLRVMGRATQGVKLINIQESDNIGAVTKVDHEDEELTIDTELNTNGENPEINSLPPEESKE
jgi:DNA gyrase subunit A